MFRPFYAFVGYRYTHVKRKNHFISFISFTSVIGIALGVGVLIAVLSVMNGFDREIRAQMLSGTPHITLGKIGEPLTNWQPLIKTLMTKPHIKGATPFILGQGMISSVNTGQVQGLLVKGIDPTQVNGVYPLATRMQSGKLEDLKPGEFGIAVGKGLANNFGLKVGDSVSLIAAEASVTPAGLQPRIRRFKVVGIFEIGDMYDNNQAFIHLQDAAKFYRLKEGVSGIQVRVNDELEAPVIARQIYQELKQDYWVTDWTQDFGSFFKTLKIQKTAMLFILLLIIMVAAFNLVSSLVMIVTDKRSDIAILRTMGASRSSVMGIFMAQGSVIGVVGTIAGVLFGLFLALNVTRWVDKIQQFFNVELVSKEIYGVGFLPSEVHTADVVGIVLVALLMSFVATLYPAWRAANIQPAEALRYE